MRASIRQVAALAGVSRTTVSDLLRGRENVALPETEARVRQAVRDLNYIPVPQPVLQSRRMRTRVIGLVIDGVEFDEPWGLPTYHGLREGADTLDYDLLTVRRSRPGNSYEYEEMRFLDRRCDAYIFVVPLDRYALMETLHRHAIPAVSCYTDNVPPSVASIMVDNEECMRQAVRHLVAQGHRRIAYIGGPPESNNFAKRLIGFNEAMAEAGFQDLSQIVMEVDGDCNGAADRIVQLARAGTITAVACAMDRFALAVQEQAKRCKLNLPRDLSITGLGDSKEAKWRDLTTIHCPFEEIGRGAMDAVVALMGGAEAAACGKVLPVELVVRGSVRKQRRAESE